jgi:hypothetical protein
MATKIKIKHPGEFTAWCKAHGWTVAEGTSRVLAAPLGTYSAHVREMANFARNFGGKK